MTNTYADSSQRSAKKRSLKHLCKCQIPKVSNQNTKNSVDPRKWDNWAHFQKLIHRDTGISACENLVLNIFPVIWDSQVSLLATSLKPHFPFPKKKKISEEGNICRPMLCSFIGIISWNPYNNSATWNPHLDKQGNWVKGTEGNVWSMMNFSWKIWQVLICFLLSFFSQVLVYIL